MIRRRSATCSGPSTAGWSRTGPSTTEDRIFAAPYLTLADPDWAAEELAWALESGARTVVMRPAAPTTALGRRNPFDPMFDGILGPGQRGRHRRRRPRRRQRGFFERICRRRIRGHLSAWLEALHQVLRHRAGHPRLPADAHLREPLRPIPQSPHRLRGERSRVPSRSDQEDPLDCQQDARVLEGRSRRDASAGTCGSTRSGRMTSTRWPTASDPIGSSSVPIGRTSRDCRNRSTMCPSSRASPVRDRRMILFDNVQELITLRPT